MNKEIREVIMKRTRLRNKYIKNQCAATRKTYVSYMYTYISYIKDNSFPIMYWIPKLYNTF